MKRAVKTRPNRTPAGHRTQGSYNRQADEYGEEMVRKAASRFLRRHPDVPIGSDEFHNGVHRLLRTMVTEGFDPITLAIDNSPKPEAAWQAFGHGAERGLLDWMATHQRKVANRRPKRLGRRSNCPMGRKTNSRGLSRRRNGKMSKEDAYDLGADQGYNIAIDADFPAGFSRDEMLTEVYEIEENGRQFAGHATENIEEAARESDDEWLGDELFEAYEEGIAKGARKGLRERFGKPKKVTNRGRRTRKTNAADYDPWVKELGGSTAVPFRDLPVGASFSFPKSDEVQVKISKRLYKSPDGHRFTTGAGTAVVPKVANRGRRTRKPTRRANAALKSRKALFLALQSIPGARLPKTYKGLTNEVYGRQAMIYPRFDTYEARRAAEKILEDQGFKVYRNYSPGSSVTEVQVSYFKGWHWDE